ncbi:MAG: glycosyltransferase [Pseudonocardiales bacterium]|nr:glycosyltransferase [Pseudonocardiales bacterium]MBV9650375.1 glycosyltransferase [Pseudonocardiales bacterium]
MTGLSVLHAAQPTEAGVATYVVGVAADQLARGWRVAVACPPGGQLAAALAARGIPRLHWPATRAPSLGTVPETRQLRQLISTVWPDVVHLHSAKAGLAGRLAVRGRRPTVFQPHGWSWLAARGVTARGALAWERLAARWTDLLVCVGEGEAAHARHRGVGNRHLVIRNGVDLAAFKPCDAQARVAARQRLGVDRDAPLAVCLGRVTRQKGQDLLLAAWPQVRSRCPAAQLCIVGDGEALPRLRARALPGVHFLAPVTDPRPWYAAADVVVLPSRWEGLSLTLLEALASGCCVVVADIPGLAEAVSTGVGVRVPAGDANALASAVARRLAEPQLRAAEGHAAAQAACAFDVRRTHDQLAAVTAELPTRSRAFSSLDADCCF